MSAAAELAGSRVLNIMSPCLLTKDRTEMTGAAENDQQSFL